MNFFEHQQLARHNSRVMVALFLLSVVAIVLAVDLVVGVIYLFTDDAPVAPGMAGVPAAQARPGHQSRSTSE